MANVSVIGAGSWGLALARRLCKNGHDVTVWSHREEGVRELREQHENRSKLPGVILPEEIQYTSSLEQAIVGKDLCVLAVPSVYTRSTAGQMKPFVTDGQIIVSVAKGIEESTLMIQTDIISQVLPAGKCSRTVGPQSCGGSGKRYSDYGSDRCSRQRDCRIYPESVHE